MKKTLFFILILVLFLPSSAQLRRKAFKQAFQPVAQKVAPSLAALFAPPNIHLGYGVALDEEHLLTCLDNLQPKNTKNSTSEYYRTVLILGFKKDYYEAELLGYDTYSRIALLRFPRELGLKPLKPPSSPAEEGDFVFSVEFDRSLLLEGGIVSAVNRKIQKQNDVAPEDPNNFFGNLFFGGVQQRRSLPREFPQVIQHDIKLELVSLGSPLVNLNGEILGINVSNLLRGTSYAIPLKEILPKIKELKAGTILKKPESGLLGVNIRPLFPQDEINEGIKIVNINPHSAAEKAGLKEGDIILALNGQKLSDLDILIEEVSSRSPGTTIELKIYRRGQTLDIPVVVGKRSEMLQEEE